MHRLLLILSIALLGVALAGCGGGASDASGEPDPQEQEAQDEDAQDQDETTTDESSAATVPTGPAPAPGTGTITLEDGREFALTVSQCDFYADRDSFQIRGSGGEMSSFDLGSDYLPDGDWYQTTLLLLLPSGKELTARATPYTEGESPAVREGSGVSWSGTVREVETVGESRSTIYTGQGSVRVTCS